MTDGFAPAGEAETADCGVEVVLASCVGCGIVVEGGAAGCQALYAWRVGPRSTDAAYARRHGLVVDTYCLQHPDRYCVSPKSFAAHLTAMCLAVELDHPSPHAAVSRWLRSNPSLVKPSLPAERGRVTIAHVLDVAGADAYARAVRDWARSTWDAYECLHSLGRAWAEAAR